MLRGVSLGHGNLLQWIEEGNIELPVAVRSLCVRCGADVNEPMLNGQTEVFYAIENGHDNYLRLLIKHHASLNIRNSDQLTPKELAIKLGKGWLQKILAVKSILGFGYP